MAALNSHKSLSRENSRSPPLPQLQPSTSSAASLTSPRPPPSPPGWATWAHKYDAQGWEYAVAGSTPLAEMGRLKAMQGLAAVQLRRDLLVHYVQSSRADEEEGNAVLPYGASGFLVRLQDKKTECIVAAEVVGERAAPRTKYGKELQLRGPSGWREPRWVPELVV